jgi:hypothetical protein
MCEDKAFQGIASLSLSFNHIEKLLFSGLGESVTFSPVVSGSVLIVKIVLRIKQVFVLRVSHLIYYSWLKVYQQGSGNIMLIVGLVKKYVFSVL